MYLYGDLTKKKRYRKCFLGVQLSMTIKTNIEKHIFINKKKTLKIYYRMFSPSKNYHENRACLRHAFLLRFAIIDSSIKLFPRKKSVAIIFAAFHHSSLYHWVNWKIDKKYIHTKNKHHAIRIWKIFVLDFNFQKSQI